MLADRQTCRPRHLKTMRRSDSASALNTLIVWTMTISYLASDIGFLAHKLERPRQEYSWRTGEVGRTASVGFPRASARRSAKPIYIILSRAGPSPKLALASAET